MNAAGPGLLSCDNYEVHFWLFINKINYFDTFINIRGTHIMYYKFSNQFYIYDDASMLYETSDVELL